MSRAWLTVCAATAIFGVSMVRSAAQTAQTPGSIGRTVTEAAIAERDITVFPDGRGLPPGRGTALEGRTVFETHCAACHGIKGEGTKDFPRLVGGVGTLATSSPVLTVGSYWPHATTLWDYNRRAMPYLQPGLLTTGEVYAVTAYILHLNGIVKEDEVLDERTLPAVRMPNRDGFVHDVRPDWQRPRR
jgi:S-disulfanyl-L-cysteine oxidoreductase SoxD